MPTRNRFPALFSVKTTRGSAWRRLVSTTGTSCRSSRTLTSTTSSTASWCRMTSGCVTRASSFSISSRRCTKLAGSDACGRSPHRAAGWCVPKSRGRLTKRWKSSVQKVGGVEVEIVVRVKACNYNVASFYGKVNFCKK